MTTATGVRRPVRQDPDERRRALYHLASPVSVLTTGPEDRMHGTTASTVTLVSRSPLLVGVVLRAGSSFARLAAAEGRYAINVLGAEQADVARRFAHSGRPDGNAAFDGLAWTSDGYAHAPLIAGALAHYVCRFHTAHTAGDSELLLGYVVRATADRGLPLFSYTGGLYAGSLRPAKEAAAS
ncbi:flavin reductase family protein [Streptomyces sp. J2-1]|uniref:flavin reductase family protein n=1 Tax=Streptomyces corallincola TaxID=2851888 RepID=UPI001C385534|nr:flavin reductase family protein [Streptomyces corallincola]MBV2355213.1 flavin reductase family protein [Streptomyces corallincola]